MCTVPSVTFAPRLSPKLLGAIVRLDDRRLPIAEVNRRVGRAAWKLGLPKPSYQRVRELVHAARAIRRGRTTARVLFDIATRMRPPAALVDHLSTVGFGPSTRRPASSRPDQRTTRTGVPSRTNRLSTSIAVFPTRMQPWETARPRSHGMLVPWIPTTPPPGQSLSGA
jgi:hypothetical protein